MLIMSALTDHCVVRTVNIPAKHAICIFRVKSNRFMTLAMYHVNIKHLSMIRWSVTLLIPKCATLLCDLIIGANFPNPSQSMIDIV